ncbi:Monothiol glutaredoxin-S16, chloroplastic-like protein [Quillaja saponaria]|uniref:Monothiol glutaredoxin-S16, chloroplastic-like protein n=1 Tax=Quillaja saponaria TaxID=32244 RepID=A0AAD7LNB3_QUISA|nr:Monothiol glutaredoxin-S16, chloroplastic-like protein [Quillaja saponaria]
MEVVRLTSPSHTPTELQFIGLSRNVEASISNHRKFVPELCISVKVGALGEPDRAVLTQAWKSWMDGSGKVPPGTESENTTWVWQPPTTDLRLTPIRHMHVPLEELIDRW